MFLRPRHPQLTSYMPLVACRWERRHQADPQPLEVLHFQPLEVDTLVSVINFQIGVACTPDSPCHVTCSCMHDHEALSAAPSCSGQVTHQAKHLKVSLPTLRQAPQPADRMLPPHQCCMKYMVPSMLSTFAFVMSMQEAPPLAAAAAVALRSTAAREQAAMHRSSRCAGSELSELSCRASATLCPALHQPAALANLPLVGCPRLAVARAAPPQQQLLSPVGSRVQIRGAGPAVVAVTAVTTAVGMRGTNQEAAAVGVEDAGASQCPTPQPHPSTLVGGATCMTRRALCRTASRWVSSI